MLELLLCLLFLKGISDGPDPISIIDDADPVGTYKLIVDDGAPF